MNVIKKEETAEMLITDLLHSATNMHLSHFMTRSYPEHIALQEYYQKIVDLADRLAESVQGLRGEIMTGYTPSINTFEVKDVPISYLRNLRERVIANRALFGDDGGIQAIIDDVIELLDSTIYKLFAFSH